MKVYSIGVEMQPMTVPKPTGFIVLANEIPVAFLEYDQVRQAIDNFANMKNKYEESKP